MEVNIYVNYAAEQKGTKIRKIIGLLSARELMKLMDAVSLRPNPRSPGNNRITKAIRKTLETCPDLLQYKTKGILAAGKIVKCDNGTYTIDFDTPSYGGILDGGHNFYSVMRTLVVEAVNAKYPATTKPNKEIRKGVESIKYWSDLTGKWAENRQTVVEFLERVERLSDAEKKTDKSARLLSFAMPVEIISPAEGTGDKEVAEIIHEISVARNNNVQLKDIAIAQHKGSYEFLKAVMPEELNRKIEWKYGEKDCPIASGKIVTLAMLPLIKLQDAGVLRELLRLEKFSEDEEESDDAVFPTIRAVSMYSSSSQCISAYSRIIDAMSNLRDTGDDSDDGYGSSIAKKIIDSLDVVKDLPEIWDDIEAKFERIYSVSAAGTDFKRYGLLKCNSKKLKKPTPTRFHTRTMQPEEISAKAGFVTPLFASICLAFLEFNDDTGKVDWAVEPKKIRREIAKLADGPSEMIRDYISAMQTVSYDPSTFGKSALAYDMAKRMAFAMWAEGIRSEYHEETESIYGADTLQNGRTAADSE